MSSFEFQNGDLEISFTYFYFLGHQITGNNESDWKDNIRKIFKGLVHEKPDRWSVDVAHTLRNEFIEQILIDHFHLDPEAIFNDQEFSIYEDGEGGYTFENKKGFINKEFKFKLGCRVQKESTDDSWNFHPPGAIECFLFKNGHLTVTLKLINSSAIPAHDVVALIRQPDLIKARPEIKRVGLLVRKSEKLLDVIEKTLEKILLHSKIEKIKSGNMDGYNKIPIIPETPRNNSEMADEEEDRVRSIPYLGIAFGFQDSVSEDIEALNMAIKRFVISAARATPAFLNSFTNPDSYLASENRNAYIPGDSIVYIAKRGWCVFDAGVQDNKVFYNNVIETTNLAILLTYSTQRTWYQYYRFLKDNGRPYFDKLNEYVIELVKSERAVKEQKRSIPQRIKKFYCHIVNGNGYLKNCKDAIADATGFIAKARILAPSSRMSQLFVAHMMSHTARAAVRRCEYICHLVEIEDAASRTLTNYSNSLKIAASHFQSGTRILSEKRLRIGVISLFISLFVGLLTYFTKLNVEIHNQNDITQKLDEIMQLLTKIIQ